MKAMSQPLPRLRMNLDFMPSPVPDHPGLLIRDPFHYSDATMIVPPVLVECLDYFDGERTESDLRSALFQITGDLQVGTLQEHLISSLRDSGFLEDETYQQMRAARERSFAEAATREPAHAGAAYPDEPEELSEVMREYMAEAEETRHERWMGLAAPRVSPEGGWQSYQSGYAGLDPARDADRTVVVVGTSHYGRP